MELIKKTLAQIFGLPPSLRFIKVSKRGRNGRIWSSHKLEGEICPSFSKIIQNMNISENVGKRDPSLRDIDEPHAKT